MRIGVGRAIPLILFAASLGAADVRADSSEPYALPNTQVRQLQSTSNNAIYRLYVATPPEYAASGKKYPVVYMLDADYSFAMTRNIVQFMSDRGKLPEMILVAIAYPGAADDLEVYQSNRKRDYTPPTAAMRVGYGLPKGAAKSRGDGRNGQGGAEQFRSFIADQVVPYMESRFPVSQDRTFIGHSYGGLFGTYVMLTEPNLFQRYVIVSPSLWFDNGLMLKVEARGGVQRRGTAQAYFAIGSLETAATVGAPMVQQLRQFANQLQSSGALRVTLDVREGETHESVFPGAVTRGLETVFQGVGPRNNSAAATQAQFQVRR